MLSAAMANVAPKQQAFGLVALIPWLVMIVAVLGGLLWHMGDTLPRLGRTVSQGQIDLGGDFTLTGQDGQPVSSTDFRGRYMLIYFGFTYCPDVCPLTLANMADALAKLGPRRSEIVPVFISVDPERDTPDVVKAYVQSFGDDFVGLTGSLDAVKQVAAKFHVYFAKHALEGGNYSVDHSSVIYLMGRDGKLATYYNDAQTPEALAADLSARL